MPLRIVQWNTGIVGSAGVRAIAAHPDLELVGCFAWSEDKVGRDVGELCGLPPMGVRATNDVDALLALRPDCVLYTPQFADVDLMVRILESGSDVVSTSYFITGRSFGAGEAERLDAAARRGGVSLYGTGINPGFANIFALLSSGVCQRVDRISVLESVDSTHYDSAETWRACGLGRPIDDPEIAGMAKSGTSVFQDAVEMMAAALALELEEIRYDVEFAAATETVELGYMTIEKGCATGIRQCWSGLVAGRPVIELPIVWTLGYTMEPSWPVENGYVVEIDGLPSVRSRIEILHPESESGPDFGLNTVMPAIHAIAPVCAAPPGIVLAHELPLLAARGLAGVEATRAQ
ncbi:MAG: dihydrodipicolinate reductase [Deltaproteobacteria bacterium]|jgi:hypothetical protein|nr:dihydrodipicolinate reductase [Deltaproteobacteria bacterium]